MSKRITITSKLDAIAHLKGTKFFLSLYLNASRIYNPGILAFTHIVLRLNEASAKHLQDMPVKVADRYDTGCVDANITGFLDIC